MLIVLFHNATTIIAFITLGNYILINQEITPSAPLRFRLFFSSMAGLLVILLMLDTIQVMPSVTLDFRNIVIIISAMYCGFTSAILTGLIIGIFLFFYAGSGLSSILGVLTTI